MQQTVSKRLWTIPPLLICLALTMHCSAPITGEPNGQEQGHFGESQKDASETEAITPETQGTETQAPDDPALPEKEPITEPVGTDKNNTNDTFAKEPEPTQEKQEEPSTVPEQVPEPWNPPDVPPGSDPVDKIIAKMPPNSWAELPNTKMQDVCPAPYRSNKCRAVIGAWSGGAYDTKRERMLIFGGGHADSWYNNLFAFDLRKMKWLRLTEMPKGSNGTSPVAHWNYIKIEPCGFYPKQAMTVPDKYLNSRKNYIAYEHCEKPEITKYLDFQQPRSTHSYNKNVYHKGMDRFCYLAGSYYPSAQSSGRRVVCYDFATQKWVRIADIPSPSRGCSGVDAKGNIWYLPNQTGKVYGYDPKTNKWTKYAWSSGLTGTADVDRKRNKLVQYTEKNNVSRLYLWDLNQPNNKFSIVKTSKALPNFIGANPGFVYADTFDRFVVWSGGAKLYSLDPITWAWKTHTGTGTPPPQAQRNGTFGRFRYVPSKKVFILVNATGQNVFLYKPPSSF